MLTGEMIKQSIGSRSTICRGWHEGEYSSIKLHCCMLVGTLPLSKSDSGDKLGCTILCAGGGVALRIYYCMSKENCCCMASDNLGVLTG